MRSRDLATKAVPENTQSVSRFGSVKQMITYFSLPSADRIELFLYSTMQSELECGAVRSVIYD